MHMFRRLLAMICPVVLVGCASVPPVKINYYLANTAVSFKLVRTVACNADDRVLVSDAPLVTAAHSANIAEIHSIELKALRGTFSDADIKVDFFEDGRLRGINASSTGQAARASSRR